MQQIRHRLPSYLNSTNLLNKQTPLVNNTLIDAKDVVQNNSQVQAFIQSFNTGKPFGILELNRNVFGLDVREDLIARVLKYERSFDYAGTESTKSLSQVRGSAQKPFPGKGRGKARVSSIRAPQFRGGLSLINEDTMYMAQDHIYALSISKKKYMTWVSSIQSLRNSFKTKCCL